MTTRRSALRSSGFTLVEMLVVIAILGILAALLLPALSQAKGKSQRIACINNLQQLGVAFHSFAHDHHSQFPMRVSQTDGGSKEIADAAYESADAFQFSYRHFQPLSNHLGSPQVLICPADDRSPAPNFAALRNDHLSYFVTPNARLGESMSLLAGDRNLARGSGDARSVYRVETNQPLRWSEAGHRFKGNLLFGDGHVEQANARQLELGGRPAFRTTDLHLPTVLTIGTTTPSTARTGPTPPVRPQVEPGSPLPTEPASQAAESNATVSIGSRQAASGQSGVGAAVAQGIGSNATTTRRFSVTNPAVSNAVTMPTAAASSPTAPAKTAPQKARTWWWVLLLAIAIVAWRIRREWKRTARSRHAAGGWRRARPHQ